jgi:DNA-binding transcriptional ArsR family regulator
MPDRTEHSSAYRALPSEEAEELAETLKALGSPARLRMLTALADGHRTVEQLAEDAGLGASATSHHLRILRALRLVRAHRDGRHVLYALHDHHVAELLAAVRHHHEHVHPPAPIELPATPHQESSV